MFSTFRRKTFCLMCPERCETSAGRFMRCLCRPDTLVSALPPDAAEALRLRECADALGLHRVSAPADLRRCLGAASPLALNDFRLVFEPGAGYLITCDRKEKVLFIEFRTLPRRRAPLALTLREGFTALCFTTENRILCAKTVAEDRF